MRDENNKWSNGLKTKKKVLFRKEKRFERKLLLKKRVLITKEDHDKLTTIYY